MTPISRREFIALSSLGIASRLAPNGGETNVFAGQGMERGGIIDPPPGEPFQDPVEATNRSGTPGIVEIETEARIAPVTIDGRRGELMT
jgi:hypothetical protein